MTFTSLPFKEKRDYIPYMYCVRECVRKKRFICYVLYKYVCYKPTGHGIDLAIDSIGSHALTFVGFRINIWHFIKAFRYYFDIGLATDEGLLPETIAII